jgi:formylglycine-generating enzyme required for sulfatase activity
MKRDGLELSDFQVLLSTLLDDLRNSRALSDEFFARLTPEGMYLRSIAERHRVIFYLGHLEAFDLNLLATKVFLKPTVNPALERLFAFGIDPIDGNLPTDVPSDWPTLPQVREFCKLARSRLDVMIAEWMSTLTQAELPVSDALAMAIEHRFMHLETLSYMLPHLPQSAFVPSALVSVRSQPGPTQPGYDRVGGPHAARQIAVPAGPITIGRNRDQKFGWDNEFDAQTSYVPAFMIDARKVVNEEFLSFVRAGGYRERSFWTDEDWAWKESRQLQQPILWQPSPNGFRLRAAFEEIPLPLDWPVQVSLAEARAYVRYLHAQDPTSTARLPSEAELHRAAYAEAPKQETDTETPESCRPYPWPGAEAIPLHHGNFGGVRLDLCPVAAFPAGDSALGVSELLGNHWEWTQTPFRPLPGFAIDPRYPGYSKAFFDDKHFVMKGAAACTDVRFLRRTFRNWFQAHYPYVFASFRCVYQSPIHSPRSP